MKSGRSLAVMVGLGLAASAVTIAVAASRSGSTAAPGSVQQMLPPAQAFRARPSKVDYARLESRIDVLMREPAMVGLAVGTVEDGEVRFLKGFGETVAGSHDPVTPHTVFRWASVSKGVATALVGRLAEERKLSLDAPLSSMGTSLTLPGDSRRVTVADVLSHRLGLVRNAWDERLEAGEDPRTLRAALGTLPVYCAPGTCYAYQNIAFDAATEMVERASGQSYATAARTRLFAPLGMSETSVGLAGLQTAASWARPHPHGRTPGQVSDAYYRVPAAGGVNSSIRDLTRWMQAQMGEAPEVLSSGLLETLHRPRVATPPHGRRGAMDRALTDASYGLGWRSFHYAGRTLVGHRGAVDGYGALVLFDPAQRSGIAMLWNSNDYRAARLQLEFFDMLYGLPATDWLDVKPRAPRIARAEPRPGTSPAR